MAYEILNTETVKVYLLKLASMRDFFGVADVAQLEAKDVGDGNVNQVFVVGLKNDKKKNVIVKQAVPYLRCAGPDYPLAKERMHYEMSALQKFKDFSPAHVPTIYHSDKEMCLVVMQYLDSHIILRKGMITGTRYPKMVDHVTTFLAETLFKTSSLYLGNSQKHQLIMNFNNNELREITEKFVFSYPFMSHETNKVRSETQKQAEALWSDINFKKNVLRLKNIFMTKTDALLHGDLHTGSIMANENETYVIDPEFAFVGPFGFDLGAMLANMIMSWISHFERSRDAAYQEWVLTSIEQFLKSFVQKFLALWNQHLSNPLIERGFLTTAGLAIYQKEFMKNLLQEAIGFAGCKIARRQLGIAGVEDIRGIADSASAARAEKMALTIAKQLVINFDSFNNVSDLVNCLRVSIMSHYPSRFFRYAAATDEKCGQQVKHSTKNNYSFWHHRAITPTTTAALMTMGFDVKTIDKEFGESAMTSIMKELTQ